MENSCEDQGVAQVKHKALCSKPDFKKKNKTKKKTKEQRIDRTKIRNDKMIDLVPNTSVVS
jgi:hypothetical protein